MGLSVATALGLSAWADEGTVAFGAVRDKITVPVMLNAVGPYPFILDLGVPRPVMGDDVAGYLKLEPDAAGGTPKLSLGVAQAASRIVHVDRVDLGQGVATPCSATMQTFVAMDLAPFSRLLGTPVAGLISPRGIADEFTLDFDAKTLTLRKESASTIRGEQEPYVVRCQVTDQGWLTVNALVDGSHMRRFVIDTALGAVLSIPEQALASDGVLSAEAPRLSVARAAQSTVEPSGQAQVRLKSIRLGSAEILEPVCAVGAPGDEPRIGLGFLKHFRMTCNFERGLLRLEPIAAGPLRDPAVLGCGLTLGQFVEGYWRVWVAQGSLAAKAGLLSGSVLLEIGGTDLKDMPYAGVAEKLGGTEGATVNVVVLQGGERRIAVLTVAKLL